MSRIKRPSPSMVIALIALFVALGGTGYAAVTINGKNIKTRTITGKKVKNNTLTGKQIAESKLGIVPKAKTATSAATATALSATGKAGFVPAEKILTTGLVKLPSVGTTPATSPKKPILTKGPFTLSAQCWTDGANKENVRLSVVSTEANSDLGASALSTSNDDLTTNQAQNAGQLDTDLDFETFATPSGKTLAVATHIGVNGFGSKCFVAANTLTHP